METRMRKSLMLVVLGSIGFAFDALAAPSVVTKCNACSGLEAKNAADLALHSVRANGKTTPYVYVRDDSANTLTQYGIRLNEKIGGLTTYFIGPASSETVEAYDKAAAALSANGGSSVFHYYFPHNDPFFPSRDSGLSGYGFVSTSQAQNDVSDILMDRYGLSSVGPMDFVYKVFAGNSPYTVAVTVVMSDGSRITMTFDGTRFTMTEARDGSNNNIPLSKDHVPGTYRGYDGGVGMSGYLHDRFGAEINVSGPVCYNYTMACTSSGSAIRCELVRCP